MRARKGFTLIELLVVIAIIAILAAILFPVFMYAKQRSQMAACQSNMKQLASAMILYCGDWNGYFVMSARGQTWANESQFVFWGSAIKKYCATKHEVNYCPAVPPYYDAVGAGGYEWRYYWGTTIGMNVALGQQANSTWIPPSCTDQVRVPTKTIMLGDSSVYWYTSDWKELATKVGHWVIMPGFRSSPKLGYLADLNPRNPNPTPGVVHRAPGYWQYDMFDPKRHNGNVNIACVDGHIVTKTRQWLLDTHASSDLDPEYTWWDVPRLDVRYGTRYGQQ